MRLGWVAGGLVHTPPGPVCLWHPLEAMGGCQSPSQQGEKGRGHLSFQPGSQSTPPGLAHCLPVDSRIGGGGLDLERGELE